MAFYSKIPRLNAFLLLLEAMLIFFNANSLSLSVLIIPIIYSNRKEQFYVSLYRRFFETFKFIKLFRRAEEEKSLYIDKRKWSYGKLLSKIVIHLKSFMWYKERKYTMRDKIDYWYIVYHKSSGHLVVSTNSFCLLSSFNSLLFVFSIIWFVQMTINRIGNSNIITLIKILKNIKALIMNVFFNRTINRIMNLGACDLMFI